MIGIATYVVSDIHGEYELFIRLLEEIRLKQTDTLYVLGDILDRGPHPIQIILKIMEMPNVVCLTGNHELMALECLEFLMQEITKISIEKVDEKMLENLVTWQYNGSKSTIDEFRTLSREMQYEVIDFIKDFMIYEELTVKDYLHDIEICQNFAKRNRVKISEIIYSMTGIPGGMAFHTIHNYIDTKEMILRKGAIAAHEGEKVLIPINMRDGSILAIGKGNPEWNYSAPHGAGRIMSRRKAKKDLKLDDYIKAMEGIYTTSVNENTLDEAPMAYKGAEDIIEMIKESVDIIDILKPIYNFKSSE